MFNNAARKAGEKARVANMKQRGKLAKKYGLKAHDFMPQQIVETALEHNIPESLIRNLLPKKKPNETSIPLSAVPKRNKPQPRRAGLNNTTGQQIALALLTALNKLL